MGAIKYLCFLLIAILLLQACKKESPQKPAPVNPPPVNPPVTPPYVADNSFKIVAYFPSYRNPDSVAASKYKMITHLFYAFLNPDKNGGLKPLEQSGRFNQVISAAKANGVKTGISVSGPDSIFVQLAASATARNTLVKNLVNFARLHSLDGVDMDWEYPRSGISDLNFAALMKELSDSLHKHNKFLSAAITPAVYAGSVRDGIRQEVFGYTDFFNIMVYDGLGWDSTDPKQHASYRMATSSLDQWLINKGMPKEKAVLGIPVYGKNAANASRGYRDLVNTGAKAHLDSATSSGQLYYYNGTATTKRKAMLAKQRANGVMFWEFYFDTNNQTSLLKAANDTLGRAY